MVDLRLWQMLSLGCGTLFWLAMGVWILKGMAYGVRVLRSMKMIRS